ncbi:hypothetical protein ACOME3_008212 [Neoechinorhynchus agilis]
MKLYSEVDRIAGPSSRYGLKYLDEQRRLPTPPLKSPIRQSIQQRLSNQSHSITVLAFMFVVLVVISGMLPQKMITVNLPFRISPNQRGLIAGFITFVTFAAVYLPDGPFKRPHPIIWRIVGAVSLSYFILLVYMLNLDLSDARKLCSYVDSSLNKPLPERNYGGNCIIYDVVNNPDDPFHNVKDKCDVFVVAHLLGWWVKALVIRDVNILLILSAGFELLEYTLQTQLPNFEECWWDHWIVDFALCNAIGIWAGMKTCEFLVRPSSKRFLGRFGPNDFVNFEWRPLENIKRWLTVLFLIACFLLQDLGTFYLKHSLWLPAPHPICLVRLGIYTMAGGVAIRETFDYLDNTKCKKLGMQAWIMLCCLISEVLVTIKWDLELLKIPINPIMIKPWLALLITLILFTIAYFGFLKTKKQKKE